MADDETREDSGLDRNCFRDFFEHDRHGIIQKWDNYFEVYRDHLRRFMARPITFLEVGVSQGGSIELWRHCLHPDSLVIGVDVNPRCKRFERDGVRILIGDQSDPEFWRSVVADVPTIDVFLDDGGHLMTQQIATFEAMYPRIAPDGVYICEDTHTSYAPEYGGGYGVDGTFIEHAKRVVDQVHAWHAHATPGLPVDEITRSTHSIHFYDGIIVFEKRLTVRPRPVQSGSGARTEP